MPKLTDQQLQTYFASAINDSNFQLIDPNGVSVLANGNRHPIYAETVLQYHPLKIHADGLFPKAMISERRPSESSDILLYRQKTYKAVTKLPLSKVLTSLSKIRRSPDWMINFPTDKVPAKLSATPDDTLESYCNTYLPGYGNITDWIFSILLKQNAIDPNALVAVLPLDNLVGNEFYKPVPIIFNSDHVLEFSEEKQFSILQSRLKVDVAMDGGVVNYKTGFRFYYIDDKEVVIYDQTSGGYTPVLTIAHTLKKMPVFKVKAEVYKNYDNMIVNKSRLDAMTAFLDEAACEYSDYKGSKIQHLYPLFWYYQNRDCNACNGHGKKTDDKKCEDCDGTGKVKFSPFAHLQLQPPALGEQGTPNPPAGFIARDVAILKLQDESVEKNNFKALAAINMQFLDQTPLNISGDAKNVDREELNNFVYNFAEDLIATADRTIYWINEWRYSFFVPGDSERRAMLPNIPVPQNFDLLPSGYLIDEITKMRAQKVNPFLLAKLEEQLAEKKFYNEPKLKEVVKLFFELDPLPGVNIDDKMTMLQNKGITQVDFVLSNYMAQFIKKSLEDDPAFVDKKYDEQMAALTKLAKAKIAENDQAAQMIDQQKQAIIDEMKKAGGTVPAGGGGQ